MPLIGFSRNRIEQAHPMMSTMRVSDAASDSIRGALTNDGRCDTRHLPMLHELLRHGEVQLSVLIATIEQGARVFVYRI